MHWLACSRSAVPDAGHWLGARERHVLEGLTYQKRRRDWLLGRWTAKAALERLLPGRARVPADWEILAAADGAPEAWLGDEAAGVNLSLSHSHGHCLCAISEPGLIMGCDIERIEARSHSFEETYFTGEEMQLLDGSDDRNRAVTLIWSAKESVLKALRTGLRSDTRRIRIEAFHQATARGWGRFHAVDAKSGSPFPGSWQCRGEMLMTIACGRAQCEPWEL